MRFTEIKADDVGAVDAAVAHLSLGGLLAHPTGSVYGIGGAPDAMVEREVARLKGRSRGPGLVHLVAATDDVRRAWPGAAWPASASRLADRFWPGPLTLVVDDGSGHGIAVRVEPHEFTRSVVRRWGRPLSSSSLNRAGEPPTADPDAARVVLEGLPESEFAILFVDAGPLPGPPPSTLVRVPGEGGQAFDVLREGAVEPRRIGEALAADGGERSGRAGGKGQA